MKKRKILFLGEVFRADAQTWINGLREFGQFEIVTWELNEAGTGWRRLLRFAEFLTVAPLRVRRLIAKENPDMIIAERTTSFGFLAAISGLKPIAIAQQGITDLYPIDSPLIPIKRRLQKVAFKNADLIHSWGPVMTNSMRNAGADMNRVLEMPKGIDLRKFGYRDMDSIDTKRMTAIVTRSLLPDYRHDVILEAAALIQKKGISMQWVFVGDGFLKTKLENQAKELGIDNIVTFKGRVDNMSLPALLSQSLFYVSMPVTEGVSASLFEAMAVGCYPIVTNLPGNSCWITEGENGSLISKNDFEMLADTIIKLSSQRDYIKQAVIRNRKFVEMHACYEVNMKLIAEKYHKLIDKYEASGSNG